MRRRRAEVLKKSQAEILAEEITEEIVVDFMVEQEDVMVKIVEEADEDINNGRGGGKEVKNKK